MRHGFESKQPNPPIGGFSTSGKTSTKACWSKIETGFTVSGAPTIPAAQIPLRTGGRIAHLPKG